MLAHLDLEYRKSNQQDSGKYLTGGEQVVDTSGVFWFIFIC